MKKGGADIHGALNVYKEKGYTSFDVVAVVRKLTNARTGHTGTLDPDAEGVLPVCLGKATKLCGRLTDKSKEYIAGIKLGIVTDTQDASGATIKTAEVTVSENELLAVLSSFQGEYAQIPPMFSAIKIGGKKLYELARNGKEIEREKRNVTIYGTELLEFDGKDELQIHVSCSKGTYIRTLANDIGERLGCGAHMSSLIRSRSGSFQISESLKLDDIKSKIEDGRFDEILIPIENLLPELKKITALPHILRLLVNGNSFSINDTAAAKLEIGEEAFVFGPDEKLAGIYKLEENGILKPVTMLL